MKKINLLNIDNNLEEIVLMKMDIEAAKPKDEPKLPLTEFLSTLQIVSTIFVDKGTIIPFTMIKGKSEDYFVYCASVYDSTIVGDVLKKKIDDALINLEYKLHDIGYDLSKLEKKNVLDIVGAEGDMMNSITYFIINDEYYV